MVTAVILERNPELSFESRIDISSIVDEVFDLYGHSISPHNLNEMELRNSFYQTSSFGPKGTCSYIAKAVTALLFENAVSIKSQTDNCCIS